SGVGADDALHIREACDHAPINGEHQITRLESGCRSSTSGLDHPDLRWSVALDAEFLFLARGNSIERQPQRAALDVEGQPFAGAADNDLVQLAEAFNRLAVDGQHQVAGL